METLVESNTVPATYQDDTNSNKILQEIQKCELVCANCHCARTWNRKQK